MSADPNDELQKAREQLHAKQAKQDRVAAMAALEDDDYDEVRKAVADELGWRVTTLDDKRKKLRDAKREAEKSARPNSNGAAPPTTIIEQMNANHALIWMSGELRMLWTSVWDNGIPRTSSVESARLYYRKHAVRGSNPVDIWVESEERREFDRIAFEPGNDDPRVFNLWRGWPAPMRGNCPLILEHIKTMICSGDEALYAYLVSYLADIAQYPGDRKGTAIALRGPPGAGKGAFWRYCAAAFAPYVKQFDNAEQFLTRFNDQLAGKLFVFVDEAAWPGDRKGLGHLKGLITEPTMQVERKYQPAFDIENHARFLFSTNNDWAIPADFDDRRFVMIDVKGMDRDASGYFEYFEALATEQKHGGAAAFLHYLLHYPITINLRKALATAALAEQKLLSLDDVGRFWRLMLTAKVHKMAVMRGRDWDELAVTFGTVIKTNDLYELYERYASKSRVQHPASFDALGRALRRYCPGIQKREARKTDDLFDPKEKRQRIYVLPTMEAARQQFSAALRQPVDLGEPDESRAW